MARAYKSRPIVAKGPSRVMNQDDFMSNFMACQDISVADKVSRICKSALKMYHALTNGVYLHRPTSASWSC